MTVNEVSLLLKVNPVTLKRWRKSGNLAADKLIRAPHGGHPRWYYSEKTISDFLKGRPHDIQQ